MAPYQVFMVVISFISFFITIPPHLISCATAMKKSGGFSLKLIHRDSPESPLYLGHDLTFSQRMSRYAKWSNARALYLASIMTQNATSMDVMMRPPVYADGNFYMVKLAIGNPKQFIMLLLDTGAGLTWTQCLPCESCYYQRNGIYNSTASQNFQLLPCTHPLCSNILQCKDNVCTYDQYYGSGGSHTIGVAMTESLTFPTNDGHIMVIHNFVMGCSRNNQNFPFASTGNIGGILGLSLSPHSFASQLDGVIERKFSYCLTPDPRLSTYLRFGSDIVVRGVGQVQTTPFVRLGGMYYYGLDLEDISISGKRINYPEGTFAPRAGGGGGCFIDSGATLTIIEESAFNTFLEAFANYFAPNQLVRNTVDCRDPHVYCYYSPQGGKQFPYITLHFRGGANYDVSNVNVIALDHTGLYFMLMIQPADRTILGAWQQHNMRLVYDLNEGTLSFVPEDCYKDVN